MNKTILVTGSSRGLGATIAKTLSQQGYNIIINYYKNKSLAEDLVSDIGSDHAIAIQADVTNRNDIDHLIEQATQYFGKIDVVINNALVGFKFDPTQQKSFAELAWDDYQQQIDGTLKAAFNVTQSVMPQFLERQQGIIISIGTNLYQNPVVPYHEYTTAKAGLIGFTRNIAAELGKFGIRANVVSGGLLKTTDASATTTTEVFDMIAQTTPLKRVTSPQDIANMVAYLASEQANGITGQNFTVDGGLTMN
ncbi:3-oxoacyl-ACP reductase [Staphylococcus equorum]|uniref:3-ketoacyl-ACP reductase n=1 Tax=Staphylococcus equorum TaxID=246432 RepID=A0AAP7LUC9_9STAP|nr:3-oxoacyl-ACP reductase [Staphylococcus equorum]ERH36006.1 3-ketoacyl-ACP reductase [Staphylococcus equorum UMC-CNS-924]KKI54141.1 3-oxoacyl-[acyl-carrier protein] reductase [Staphylococcus equorum subsp. equorum]MCE5047152.1 3-oxoacyl-ACP reductase [Staphylococcus equorum]MDG0825013.1 3-oxoacyl-ACP reductase [Staphylococcus equorum]MDK9862209.1 3-oxoacyl-ACP reductase [Staphylococcus equorum]